MINPDNFVLSDEYKHLYGSLYSVPFEKVLLSQKKEEGDVYQFSNPRLNTLKCSGELKNKYFLTDLKNNIKQKTLLNPLVCRWVMINGEYFPQLVGGERRYHALKSLIENNELVCDNTKVVVENKECKYSINEAKVVYNRIPCQIFFVSNDLDALALSWAENKSRINLTDGAEIVEVMKLRKYGANDNKIVEILQVDTKWLAQTDNLINSLDANTLNDLIESNIDRQAALELLEIKDLNNRDKIRVLAIENAKKTFADKVENIKQEVNVALDFKEIQEAELAYAEEDKKEEIREKIDKIDENIKKNLNKINDSNPQVGKKDIRKVLNENENKEEKIRTLSANKIEEGVNYLNNLIIAEGNHDEFTADVNSLRLLTYVLENNILKNNPNFENVLKDFFN